MYKIYIVLPIYKFWIELAIFIQKKYYHHPHWNSLQMVRQTILQEKFQVRRKTLKNGYPRGYPENFINTTIENKN